MKGLLSKWCDAHHDRNFLALESAVAAGIALGLIVASNGRFLEHSRPAIYTGLASASASLLGFTLTSLSLTLGFLDRKHLKELCTELNLRVVYEAFSSTLILLGATAVCNFFCLAMDTDKDHPHWIGSLLLCLVLLSMFRFARCCWMILSLVKIITNHLVDDASTAPDSAADEKNASSAQ